MPCIRQRFPSGRTPAWEFERDGETLALDPDGPLISTNIALQRRAALDGVGLWLTFDGYVEEDISSGRLVSVLDPWLPSFPGPSLYYPSRRQMRGALRAFVDFVKGRR